MKTALASSWTSRSVTTTPKDKPDALETFVPKVPTSQTFKRNRQSTPGWREQSQVRPWFWTAQNLWPWYSCAVRATLLPHISVPVDFPGGRLLMYSALHYAS